MEPIETIESEGLRACIYVDEEPFDPRKEYDNFGRMVCFHKKYRLGDGHDITAEDFAGWEAIEEHLRKELGAVVVLPLYLYDHSGITVNTTGYSCPWDSCQVGFTYATAEDILKNWGGKEVTKELLQKAEDLLRSEVETYDQYLTGQVYGYVITAKDGSDLPFDAGSCWGIYGLEWTKKEAASELAAAVREANRRAESRAIAAGTAD